jgi:L-iditol 2-dehydrogenase
LRTVLLHGPRNLSVEECGEPLDPTGHEVLVQIRRVTLCGSDIHYYRNGRNSSAIEFPIILGHEASGVVIEVGEKVTSVKPGDRVAIEPGKWCGKCRYCERNQYQFCEMMRFMASKGYPGALQEKVLWPESMLWKLPDGMSLEEGALLEPLSVAYAAMEDISFTEVSHAVILGAGSIGLLAFKLISHLHPHVECTLVDRFEERFELANLQGIPLTRTLATEQHEDEIPASDLVIDTTGNPGVIGKAFRSMNKAGQLVLIGLSQEALGISVLDLVYKGVTIKASYRYSHTYPKLIELSQTHLLDTSRLITHRFHLDSAPEAFETALSSKDCLKVVIEL